MNDNDDLRDVPDRLYKYRSDRSKFLLDVIDRGLRSREVYFSRCADLNDPFDNLAAIEDSPLKDVLALQKRNFGNKPVIPKERLVKLSGKSGLRKSEINVFKPSARNAHAEILSVRTALKLQKKDGAVACFSAKRCNLPMWAHYANEGKGLVLVYRYNENFHKILESEPVPLQVHYCDQRTRLTTIDVIHFSNQDLAKNESEKLSVQKCFRSMFLEKSSDWSYEDEWRFVMERGLHGYRKVHCLELVEIIFGPHISERLIESVNEVVRGSIPLVNTSLDKFEFKLTES